MAKQVASSAGTDRFDYEYDAAGRLTEVKKNGAVTETYQYDQNSNRTQTTYAAGPSADTKTATFDNRDRMTTYGDLELQYNADGELTSKTNNVANEQTTFEYSTFGRLTSATLPTGQQITYITDGTGNRVARQVSGQTTSAYLYAPGMINPVAELDENGNLEASFIYATKSHSPDYMVKGSVTYRMISDQLGSIRLVVDAQTGAVVQEIEYDSFGRVLSDSNPGFQPFAFAGGLYDSDTKLTHFGAREYDAELGRWTSSDPIGFAGGDSNLYGYVLGDPVNYFDPYGLFGLGDVWDGVKDVGKFVAAHGDTIMMGIAAGVCIASAPACAVALAASSVVSISYSAYDFATGKTCAKDFLTDGVLAAVPFGVGRMTGVIARAKPESRSLFDTLINSRGLAGSVTRGKSISAPVAGDAVLREGLSGSDCAC
ncbi:MAG: RHS repeat domain-containing protein [Solirubrobacterales bacterium]